MSLESLGWNPAFARALNELNRPELVPARVVREDRDRYLIHGGGGPRPASLAGRLRHEASRRADLPAVGDWVAAHVNDAEPASTAGIVSVLPRASAFIRRAAGEAEHEQVVAANVDTVFLVTGLDGDFNPRRIERYVAAAWESGAVPVVVLTKSDLVDDLEARLAEAEAVAPGVPVVAVAAAEGVGLEALEPWLLPAKTVALLGSSGTGKSTLVNALLGESRQETTAVRENDSHGRHTTTRRELLALPGGALLVDTPGMRTLGLWSDGEGLADAFPDLESIAERCRFRDCAHAGEPGCAVAAALENGLLDPERFASWRKLQRELEHLAARTDPRLAAERRAKWKAIHASMKHHPKSKRNR